MRASPVQSEAEDGDRHDRQPQLLSRLCLRERLQLHLVLSHTVSPLLRRHCGSVFLVGKLLTIVLVVHEVLQDLSLFLNCFVEDTEGIIRRHVLQLASEVYHPLPIFLLVFVDYYHLFLRPP